MLKRIVFLALIVTFSLAATANAPTRYGVDMNHSTVGFAVPILGGLSRVAGKFSDFSVDMEYDATDIAKSSVLATIKATSIDTGIEGRDNHLRTPDFFDVAKFPEITFQSTKIEKRGNQWIMTGNLSMHGVTKETSFPFELVGSETNPTSKVTTHGFAAKLKLDRRDFGITWQHKQISNWVGYEVEINLNMLTRVAPARTT